MHYNLLQSSDWERLTSTVGAVSLEVLVTRTGEATNDCGTLGCRVTVVVLWVTEDCMGKKDITYMFTVHHC